jgi:anti-sigma factor RsiW
MREENEKSKEGLALWRRARTGWQPVSEDEAPDALLLAGYLDGRLSEAEAARLEARLAAEPALLDELLALRASLAAGPQAAPAAVVTRGQAAYAGRAPVRIAQAAQPSLFDRLFGVWLRPAVPAFAALALLVAFAGAFELGRCQGERLDATQTAEAGDSDVPVDLLMDGLL